MKTAWRENFGVFVVLGALVVVAAIAWASYRKYLVTTEADEALIVRVTGTAPVEVRRAETVRQVKRPRELPSWDSMRAAWASSDEIDRHVASEAEWAARKLEWEQSRQAQLARVDALKRRTMARESSLRWQDEREEARERLRASNPAVRRHDEAMLARKKQPGG